MGIEYELKYRADRQTLDAIGAGFDAPATVYQMESTYYDTPDRALSQRHITLRRRLENSVCVCTLKAPAEQGRLEFEVNACAITDAIPALCKLSGLPELPGLLENGVVPVCGARFTRRAWVVTCQDSVLEIALDQGVLTGGSREQSLCEVEVELKSGNPESAKAYAQRLALAYGLEPETQSKFKRAFLLSREVDHGF